MPRIYRRSPLRTLASSLTPLTPLGALSPLPSDTPDSSGDLSPELGVTYSGLLGSSWEREICPQHHRWNGRRYVSNRYTA